MYNIKDLFNQRSVFSTRLDQMMETQSITKAKLCKEANISRPTLDKLLNAQITNETNFEKHVTKILNVLHLTPDILMGNTQNPYNRMRQMKNILHISEESISESTGISLSRLKNIEGGGSATTSELRDIALCCKTSVRGLLGTNYFDVPISNLDYFIDKKLYEGIYGFWGHIGILTSSSDQYLWFPINSGVRKQIYYMLDQQYMVIPCMNNKLLLLNKDGIDSILLLDEACDQPDFANWDTSVSEGEIPLVLFEALDDYLYMDETEKYLISPNLHDTLERLITYKHWTEADIIQLTEGITIYYKNSKTVNVISQLKAEQTLTDAVQTIYEVGELDCGNKIVYFEDDNGTEIITNLNNISMIELPLLAVEDIICQELEDLTC